MKKHCTCPGLGQFKLPMMAFQPSEWCQGLIIASLSWSSLSVLLGNGRGFGDDPFMWALLIRMLLRSSTTCQISAFRRDSLKKIIISRSRAYNAPFNPSVGQQEAGCDGGMVQIRIDQVCARPSRSWSYYFEMIWTILLDSSGGGLQQCWQGGLKLVTRT